MAPFLKTPGSGLSESHSRRMTFDAYGGTDVTAILVEHRALVYASPYLIKPLVHSN